jgi:hypothetical protein
MIILNTDKEFAFANEQNVASSIVALATAAGLVGCTATRPWTASFAFYHNSVTDENMRIHVATFDATDGGEAYNRSNCDQAQALFRRNPMSKPNSGAKRGGSQPRVKPYADGTRLVAGGDSKRRVAAGACLIGALSRRCMNDLRRPGHSCSVAHARDHRRCDSRATPEACLCER